MTPEERAVLPAKLIVADAAIFIGAWVLGGMGAPALDKALTLFEKKVIESFTDSIRAAVEAEREGCADIVDKRAATVGLCGRDTLEAVAAAIRARKDQT